MICELNLFRKHPLAEVACEVFLPFNNTYRSNYLHKV